MKSPILALVLGSVLLLSTSLIIHAETGDLTGTWTNNEVSSSNSIENPLLIDSITTPDDAHIILKFNQSIIWESVRVRIVKQSDESNVRIESFTWGETPDSIEIVLSDILEADTSYKMTIISAISDGWVIIKDGADGLKEFTTPVNLARFAPEIVLNAPSNPNAVIIAGTGNTVTKEVKPSPSETTEELPLTGVDSTIFIIIAAIIGLFVILRRRQA